MEIMFAIGGLVVGGLIGYFLGSGPAKTHVKTLEDKLSDARGKLESIRRQAMGEIEKEKSKATQTLEKLAAVQEQSGQLRQSLDESQKGFDELKKHAAGLQKSLATAEEAAEAHKMARQQAEGRYRQAEQLASQAQQQLRDMQTQLEQSKTSVQTLKKTADRQTKELQRLRADVSSSRSSSSGLDESFEAFAETDGTLEGVLRVLLENEGQASAVVADSNGIIVAATGEEELKESMAATTQMIRTAVKQLEGMVPFEDLRSYTLQDIGANVISGRFFSCAGEDVGLATYGPRIPNERVLDGAMANLSSILE
jgi:chromosome segregation ATPase